LYYELKGTDKRDREVWVALLQKVVKQAEPSPAIGDYEEFPSKDKSTIYVAIVDLKGLTRSVVVSSDQNRITW
jgi:hypothetical protein